MMKDQEIMAMVNSIQGAGEWISALSRAWAVSGSPTQDDQRETLPQPF